MGEIARNEGRAIVHIVGAGLAGMACAVRLARAGWRPVLYEASDHAGGRCRSFFEPLLDRVIDNGNHLLLSGNRATFAYLDEIGARDQLAVAPSAAFPFLDLRSGLRWTVRPNRGRLPWWVFSPARRVPDSRPWEYFAALKLGFAEPEARVADCFDRTRPVFERFWEPLAVSVLNASAEEGAARLLWPVVALVFGKGEAASRPCHPGHGLSPCFVDPAVAWLGKRGAAPLFHHRLREVERTGERVTRLIFASRRIEVGPTDRVVLAVTPRGLRALLPDTPVPEESRAIVNAHFRLDRPVSFPGARESRLLGIVGGASQWLFLRGDVVSVTVSAADALVNESADAIARRLWPEVVRALDLPADSQVPRFRIVKEKRATFAQTPGSLRFRAKTRTPIGNLFLAGDWTDTRLPATVEGAVRSGQSAADIILREGL